MSRLHGPRFRRPFFLPSLLLSVAEHLGRGNRWFDLELDNPLDQSAGMARSRRADASARGDVRHRSSLGGRADHRSIAIKQD